MSGLNLPKFRRGLKTNFTNLASKNSDTFYFTTDTKELFIGDSPVGYRYHELNEDPSGDGIFGHIYRNTVTDVFYIYNGISFLPLNQQSQFQGLKITSVVARPRNLSIKSINNGTISINWNDPDTYSMDFGVVDTWVKTSCVFNVNRYPESIDDGTILGYSTIRNQYSTDSGNSFTFTSNAATVYLSLFAQSVNGDWTTRGGTCYKTVALFEVEDIDEYMSYMREGGNNYDLLKAAYPVGTIMPFVSHNVFTQMQWIIGGYDYKGYYGSVSDYLCGDTTKLRNVILYPLIVPSTPTGAQLLVPYDLIEASSAISIDTEFVSGKTYYTNSGCTNAYDQSLAGPNDTPASLQLYEKGRAASGNGYGPYDLSFIRQWLNSDEVAGSWYVPNSIFEPATFSFASNYDGFYRGIDSATKNYIHYARNRYTKYDGTDIIVDDRVWLPSVPQISTGSNTVKFEMFRIYTDDTYRAIKSANGTNVYGWTGTQQSNSAQPSNVKNITAQTGIIGNAGKLQGGSQGKDCAVPVMCLA